MNTKLQHSKQNTRSQDARKHQLRRPIFYISYLIFIIFGLGSCTLSMEEWAVPEEEKGFDEPETVDFEYGTMTYQYKEGVRSITENVQKYIIRYEYEGDNTIVYFMDNTPKDWLPQTGNLVSAMCTPTLPFGLNHRVTDVKNIGGMYRVECEPATREEVYEDLVFQFDGDYEIPGVAVYDSLTLDSLGIDPNDLIIEDLSLLEEHYGEQAMTRAGIHSPIRWRETPALKKLREAGIVSAGATRADDDPKQTEDEKKKEIDINLDNLNLKFSFGKGFYLSLGGDFNKTDTEHVWYYENKKDDYRKQVTTSSSTTTFNLYVRMAKERDPEKKPSPKNMTVRELEDLKNMMKSLKEKIKSLPDKEKRQKNPLSFVNIHVPIGTTGFFLVIKFEGGIDYEGGLTGHVKFTSHDPVIETTYIYDKGKETSIPDRNDPDAEKKATKKKGYTTLDEIDIAGDFLGEVWIRAAVGVELGTKLGLGCDVGFKAALGAKLKYNFWQYEQSKTIQIPNAADGFEAYLSGELAATAYFSPLGKNLFEAKLVFWHPYYRLLNVPFSPLVDMNNVHNTVETIDDKRSFHMDYRFKYIWDPIHPLMKFSHTLIPRLRVYHGNYNSIYKDFKVNELEDIELERFQKYEFNFTDDDLLGQAAKYICVPCIYDFNTNITYEFRDAAKTFGSTGASFTFKKFKQKYGLRANAYLSYITSELSSEEEAEETRAFFRETYDLKKGEEKNWMYYEFGVTYDIKNLSMYKEWGINVKLSEHEGKDVVYTKDVKAKNIYDGEDFVDITKKDGPKTIVLRFITKSTSDLYVSFKPYAITTKGSRIDFPSVGPEYLKNYGYNDKDVKWTSTPSTSAILD